METIEERASEFAEKHEHAELILRGLSGVYGYSRIYNAEICAYERGAKEQRKIDIDKAIKFTCDKCECFANGITEGYKICSLHSEPKKTCMIVKALIKAMEE